ncbi:unnamed protein product [Rhizophagus irregularis]|uniref:Uncharacterized protein n=1 Tax=Rhizophagus irregularis TaxID=588596 RepID=A0A916E6H9_9GLOM|nr:hypothetical protein OCT59_000763 [Rhizophagus irregularis]CAB4383588.1 unnamed protein product [Rhizophagus irregularis]CAB4402514.1 unnamed protein product [Rhizophagus irregularis]CAB4484821.1 unnamed protein product [Rhizophagus irregularis]CAB5361859.1 unnamed protein product [Rhizophagus irregularis]
MPHRRNYRDRSRISRQDVIIQLHKRNDSNRRRIENSSESVEFTCLLFIIIIIVIIFLVDYISRGGNNLRQNSEFVLSPQAHSFCVNEFINSVEILGNKIVSMDFLTSSKRIPMFYTYISSSII